MLRKRMKFITIPFGCIKNKHTHMNTMHNFKNIHTNRLRACGMKRINSIEIRMDTHAGSAMCFR